MELPLTAEAFDVFFADTSSCFNITFIHAARRVTGARPAQRERNTTMKGRVRKGTHSWSQRLYVKDRVNSCYFYIWFQRRILIVHDET